MTPFCSPLCHLISLEGTMTFSIFLFSRPRHLSHPFAGISSSFDDATGWLFKVKGCILFSLSLSSFIHFHPHLFPSSLTCTLTRQSEATYLHQFNFASPSPKLCGKRMKLSITVTEEKKGQCNVSHSLQSSLEEQESRYMWLLFLFSLPFSFQMRL